MGDRVQGSFREGTSSTAQREKRRSCRNKRRSSSVNRPLYIVISDQPGLRNRVETCSPAALVVHLAGDQVDASRCEVPDWSSVPRANVQQNVKRGDQNERQ